MFPRRPDRASQDPEKGRVRRIGLFTMGKKSLKKKHGQELGTSLWPSGVLQGTPQMECCVIVQAQHDDSYVKLVTLEVV